MRSHRQFEVSMKSNMVVILPDASTLSFFKTKPYKEPVPWIQVMEQVKTKLSWEKLNVSMEVLSHEEFLRNRVEGDVALLVGFDENQHSYDMNVLREALHSFHAVTTFDCSETIQRMQNYGEYDPFSPWPGVEEFIDENFLKKSLRRKQRLAHQIVLESWERKSSDDLLYMLLILIDTYSTPIKSVQSVTSTENTGLSQLTCMCKNCAREMVQCFQNPQCRKALDCLNKCRWIASLLALWSIISHGLQGERPGVCLPLHHLVRDSRV